jgi:4-azaleucine resistance transporter AzlC
VDRHQNGDGNAHVRDSIALGLAVGVFGLSFGVLASTSGLSAAKACALSLLVFTGASQFAAVGIVAAGGSPLSALGSALLLAARNAAYGLALSPVLPGGTGRRLVAAQLVIDESTAMATAQRTPAAAATAFWVTGISVFACWNLGTLVGALAGNSIGNPATLGLDAAFPAGFLALAAPHLRQRRGQVAAAAGAAIALVLVPFAPPGTPILAASLGVVPALLFVP